ncbi:MAG: hypothetical protein JWO31_3932 [Phycisphaerales bacterium]|nr:hypothetical protein [Phycisphaerales bacterium]
MLRYIALLGLLLSITTGCVYHDHHHRDHYDHYDHHRWHGDRHYDRW